MVCREQRGCEVMESLVLGFPVASYATSPVLGDAKATFSGSFA